MAFNPAWFFIAFGGATAVVNSLLNTHPQTIERGLMVIAGALCVIAGAIFFHAGAK